MTQQTFFEKNTQFGEWLRRNPQLDSRMFGLSIQNVDYVIHRYSFKSCQAVMLIEEKCFGAELPFAQKDTQIVLHQALLHANGKLVTTLRGKTIPLRYLGYHTLVFEKTSPDDGRMWWDGLLITADFLCRLLRLEVNPNLTEQSERGA